MSRTTRKKRDWWAKEHPIVRRHYNKSKRLLNKLRVKQGRPVERHDRTNGWLTW